MIIWLCQKILIKIWSKWGGPDPPHPPPPKKKKKKKKKQIWILCQNSLTRELKIRVVGFVLKKLLTYFEMLTYMWWPKFSNQKICQIWSGVLIPYQEVFYRTILMRVKVQTQFHCPLYHIYSKYSDTESIVDQDQTAPKDCSRSALFASAFIKHSLIPQKNLFKFENGKVH